MTGIVKYQLITVFIILGLLPYCGYSQESERVLAKVNYDFYHLNDTLQPEKSIQEEMVLYIGKSSTLYGSFEFNRIMRDMENQIKASAFDGNLVLLSQRHNSPDSYYIRMHDQEISHIYRAKNGTNYLLEEEYPLIEWQINDNTQIVGGYEAQQAKGEFGGRVYVVWFATELPLQGGPWKLQGLPGLVLEAESEDGDVKFSFVAIETEVDEVAEIGLPMGVVKTTPQALERLLAAIDKNPQAAFSARSAAGTGSTSGNIISFSSGGNPIGSSNIDPSVIKSISIKKDNSGFSSVINNPLEINK